MIENLPDLPAGRQASGGRSMVSGMTCRKRAGWGAGGRREAAQGLSGQPEGRRE